MNHFSSFLILLIAFVGVFMQSSFDALRNLSGAQIDILPALIIYTALTHDLVSMSLLGVLGGLWTDSLSANALGASVLPLSLIGLITYQSRSLLLRENTYAQFVLGASASALVPLCTVVTLLGLGDHPIIGWGSLWQLLVMAAAGGVLTPLCFLVFDRINLALNYRPATENSFRQDRQIKRGRQ